MTSLKEKPPKVPFFQSFFRSQITSILATAADFVVTIFFTEIANIWYGISNAFGAFTGAVISFLLGRNWAFERKDGKWHWQAVRYILISFTSMALNTGGVILVTEYFDISYIISKIVVAILVGIFFNFFMFRYFVFK